MAREEKRVGLKPVDEEVVSHPPVIRLVSETPILKVEPIRLSVPAVENDGSQRLNLPSREDVELRTHQPGIDALLEAASTTLNPMEENWGTGSAHHRPIPWGWFALIGIVLAGAVIWSVTRMTEADEKAVKILADSQNLLIDDEKEEREAAQLIDRIHKTTKEFFDATTVNGLIRNARQPERVRPLMESYYAANPMTLHRLDSFRTLQPLTMDKQANFWMASVNLDNQETRNLLIEILPSGEARVDWETLVCYQPMRWDDFAKTKPHGVSYDFRVYVQQDNFFSHEFADSSRWNCFRLTAIDSDETLFGYTPVDAELSKTILEQLQLNGGGGASMILRLNIPAGLQSRSGVIIEKLMSPRWIYMTPPDSGS